MLSACVAANAAPVAPTAGHPAEWQTYDILVHLTALPRPYTCDALWTKFRVVLISLGAGRVDEVLPTNCASTSPNVHVRLELPRPEPGAAPGTGQIDAASQLVELAPGTPAQLTAADCSLVREMRESLLTDLPVKVTKAQFRCRQPGVGAVHTSSAAAHARGGGRFDLRVQAEMPLWTCQSERNCTNG
jgi:hypothetical protein